MRTMSLLLAIGLVAVSLASGFAAVQHFAPAPAHGAVPATTPTRPLETRTVGVWRAPAALKQVPIWPAGAPDMAGATFSAENVLTRQTPEAIGGRTSQAVFDVSSPTMTVYPPRGRNTGAAVVVFPGGGFMVLAVTLEGTEICDWLTARGITCVLSKYRVPGGNHHWDDKCRCAVTPKVAWALQDAQRTIRLVRSRAKELHLDPKKIGVMGFSAGGYLVAQTSNILRPIYKPVDAADQVSSRPDFAVALYPGHLCRTGAQLDPGIHVTKRTPPTFLVQAWDDPVDEICNSTIYARALDAAGAPAEVHLFGKGGHAFGLRNKDHSLGTWPVLLEGWLKDQGVL